MTRSSRWVVLAPLTAVVFAFVAAGGCSEQEPPPPPPRYEVLPLREVPPYFEGTILQYVDVMNTEPYPISSYGLVVGLAGTGDNSNIPARVREYMLDEMFRRGFGSSVMGQRYARMKPEMVLADPGAAVVIVTAYVPPGARKGDRLDLFVNALPDSNTSSLAQGILYQTDLRIQGANPLDPRGQVNVYAYGEGRVFVNPVRAVEGPASGMGLASLRSGVVIGGGRALVDRPLMLRLRQPQRVMARAIEARIRLAFPNNLNDEPKPAALAQDEALVELYRPLKFRGDWNHYAKVATHLFLNGSREFSSAKAKVLADVAVEPGAPLESLSYCFEGLGPAAIPHIQPLYAHVSPHVAYWSARAGAMIGDSAAIHALVQVARTENHPHQMAAVRALGVLPPSAMATRVLNELLDVPNASVRIEAYRILRSQEEEPTRVDSLKVSNSFTLDIIPSPGPPLIYAARAGDPRLAVFGRGLEVKRPLFFSAMDAALTLSATPNDPNMITIMYRDAGRRTPLTVRSRPDLRELLWRLGGGAEDGLKLSYGDLVGIVQAMTEKRHIEAAFVLQEMPRMGTIEEDEPPLPDRGLRGRGRAAGEPSPSTGPSAGVRAR